jgi:hypothetical protein
VLKELLPPARYKTVTIDGIRVATGDADRPHLQLRSPDVAETTDWRRFPARPPPLSSELVYQQDQFRPA